MTSNDSRVTFDTRKAKWLFSQLGCMHPHITIIIGTCRCLCSGRGFKTDVRLIKCISSHANLPSSAPTDSLD